MWFGTKYSIIETTEEVETFVGKHTVRKYGLKREITFLGIKFVGFLQLEGRSAFKSWSSGAMVLKYKVLFLVTNKERAIQGLEYIKNPLPEPSLEYKEIPEKLIKLNY